MNLAGESDEGVPPLLLDHLLQHHVRGRDSVLRLHRGEDLLSRPRDDRLAFPQHVLIGGNDDGAVEGATLEQVDEQSAHQSATSRTRTDVFIARIREVCLLEVSMHVMDIGNVIEELLCVLLGVELVTRTHLYAEVAVGAGAEIFYDREVFVIETEHAGGADADAAAASVTEAAVDDLRE